MSAEFESLLAEAFFADHAEVFTRLREGHSKLIHYTSAENGLKLLQGRTFWLRNVKCMNDYSEVAHGIDMLVRTLRKNDDKLLKSLGEALEACAPGSREIAFGAFDQWARSLPFEVYVGCLAEHDPDDSVGLLSMWRAYGGERGGVALIFNPHPVLQETGELKAFSVPVFYLREDQFEAKLSQKIEKLIVASKHAKEVSAEFLANVAVRYLIAEAVSAKHFAFREEREFRIVYLPTIEQSQHIECENVSVRGVPQVIQKIPLEDAPEKGLHKADIPNLVERVIIGPTDYMMPVWSAFVSELERTGISREDAESRVIFSGIPLRLR
jgi:hypothetical protein